MTHSVPNVSISFFPFACRPPFADHRAQNRAKSKNLCLTHSGIQPMWRAQKQNWRDPMKRMKKLCIFWWQKMGREAEKKGRHCCFVALFPFTLAPAPTQQREHFHSRRKKLWGEKRGKVKVGGKCKIFECINKIGKFFLWMTYVNWRFCGGQKTWASKKAFLLCPNVGIGPTPCISHYTARSSTTDELPRRSFPRSPRLRSSMPLTPSILFYILNHTLYKRKLKIIL